MNIINENSDLSIIWVPHEPSSNNIPLPEVSDNKSMQRASKTENCVPIGTAQYAPEQAL